MSHKDDIDTYDIDDAPILVGTFRDQNDTLTSPTEATFEVEDPNGTKTTYTLTGDAEVTESSTGVIHCALPAVTVSGIWHWKVAGTGTVTAATPDEKFYVTRSRF